MRLCHIGVNIMIPKIIHFCWLSGDPYPDKIQQCINSWKEKLPDYEIRLWNTLNFDINSNLWVKQAYENKKYAFVSDYVRFYALYNYGGIYLDSDIEVIKSFDNLLNNQYFFGYEFEGLPEAAVIGAEKNIPWIKTCLEWYEQHNFQNEDGTLNTIVAPLITQYGFEKNNTIKLIDDGKIKNINGGMIFPFDYFSTKNGFTGNILRSNNTYTIHHFNSGWLKESFNASFKKNIHMLLIFLFGKYNYNKILYKTRKHKFQIRSNLASQIHN